MAASCANAQLGLETLQKIRLGALCTLGGYAIAISYRIGLVRAVLPAKVNAALERLVEGIKGKSQPIGNTTRYRTTRAHLLRVYGLTCVGLLTMATGTGIFFRNPKIPIAIPLATTLIPAAALMAVPRESMLSYGRYGCFLLSCLSCGYTLGPMNWIMQSSLPVFCLLAGSTITGLCVPLFLTRGMASYILSSQLLSASLSIAIICSPLGLHGLESPTPSAANLLTAAAPEAACSVTYSVVHRARQVLNSVPLLHVFRYIKESANIPSGDLNVMLTLQLLSSLTINVLHTLPTIVKFVRWKGTDESELLNVVADPVREAFCICAGTAYLSWRVFQWALRRVILRATNNDSTGATKEVQAQWARFARMSFDVDRTSSIGASVLFVLWYIRLVSAVQRDDTAAILESKRKVFEKLSPLNFVIGEQKM